MKNHWPVAACFIVLGFACDDDGDSQVDAAPPEGGVTDSAVDDAGVVYMPALDELQVGEWHELLPGGGTQCSHGAPFAFYVYHGSTNNLAVNFQGGGACWSDVTCSLGGTYYQETVDSARDDYESHTVAGITDMSNDDNPIKDYTQIFIPYCTGDVHWGDRDMTYGSGDSAFTIHHKGAVNTRAILDWVYENIEDPEHVFTTGCSAGGYGSSMWAAHLMHHYPDARQVQFSDSAVGAITDSFFTDSFPSWNATAAFPDWIEGLEPSEVTSLAMLYVAYGNYYPNAVVSQYNTIYDETQTSFYTAMGGDGGAAGWSMHMLSNIEAMHGAANFRSYVADGEQHCIIVSNDFYTRESGGVLLTDWIKNMLSGAPVDDVMCEGCVEE